MAADTISLTNLVINVIILILFIVVVYFVITKLQYWSRIVDQLHLTRVIGPTFDSSHVDSINVGARVSAFRNMRSS